MELNHILFNSYFSNRNAVRYLSRMVFLIVILLGSLVVFFTSSASRAVEVHPRESESFVSQDVDSLRAYNENILVNANYLKLVASASINQRPSIRRSPASQKIVGSSSGSESMYHALTNTTVAQTPVVRIDPRPRPLSTNRGQQNQVTIQAAAPGTTQNLPRRQRDSGSELSRPVAAHSTDAASYTRDLDSLQGALDQIANRWVDLPATPRPEASANTQMNTQVSIQNLGNALHRPLQTLAIGAMPQGSVASAPLVVSSQSIQSTQNTLGSVNDQPAQGGLVTLNKQNTPVTTRVVRSTTGSEIQLSRSDVKISTTPQTITSYTPLEFYMPGGAPNAVLPNRTLLAADDTTSGGEASQVGAPIRQSQSVAAVESVRGTHESVVVTEAFTSGQQPLGQVMAQFLGTEHVVYSDSTGRVDFDRNHIVGLLPVVFSKEGYLPRRVDLIGGIERREQNVELISRNTMRILSMALSQQGFDVPNNLESKAIIMGEVDSSGFRGDRRGIEISLINQNNPEHVINSIYFNNYGVPDKTLTSTAARGQFAFIGLEPGAYAIQMRNQNQQLASHLMYVTEGEGVVTKLNIGSWQVIRGRVVNHAGYASVSNAQIQLLGSSLTARTNQNGEFTLGPVMVDCNTLNYLQVSRRGYYRNRLEFQCAPQPLQRAPVETTYAIINAAALQGVAGEVSVDLDANAAVVAGAVDTGQSIKTELWGPSEGASSNLPPRGYDFYFDNGGSMDANLERTTRAGRFIILNAPADFSYLLYFNNRNETIGYWPVFTAPSTISHIPTTRRTN